MGLALSVPVLGAAALLVSANLAGCAGSEHETTFTAPGNINVSAGSYRNVGVGDSIAKAQAVFGPKEAVHDELIAPSDKTPDDYYGAASGGTRGGGPSADAAIYRYDDAAFLAFNGTIQLIGIDEERARTERGVRIGDSLAQAKEAYPQLTCGTANEGTEYAKYPGCTGKIGSQFIWFGGDPIKTIELGSAEFFL